MAEKVLEVNQIKANIEEKEILHGVDLSVGAGEVHVLMGPNGAGKSTMIECVLNILMSFDSPAIEKQIDYSYSMEYNYAQKAVCIVQSNHNYRITVDDVFCEGSCFSITQT